MLEITKQHAFVRFERSEVEQSLPSRFAKQVLRAPGALAVKTDEHELTYEALDRESNQVANALLAKLGPGPEPVALMFYQGAGVIVAIMGVLKAGKFYVPLDPQYPDARNAYILQDAGSRLILTTSEHADQAHGLADSVLLMEEVASYPDYAPEAAVSPDDLAYILFTSGSTGKPKGIVQSHRNLLGITMNFTNGMEDCPSDRIALIPYYTFTAAVMDMMAALMNGAALFPYCIRRDGVAGMAEWLVRRQINVAHCVPTVFRHFANTLTGDEMFPDFRILDLGGETVYSRDVELFRKHFPGCTLINGLGSTELNVIRQFRIDDATRVEDGIVPVGYAVEDTEVMLLDESGREVGVGEVGEIVIKGRYLSPGYWRNPELTNEAFRMRDGERVFHSGDLGRMSANGCLVHLGRKDLQVKIRGQRVEPGEIEMALQEIEGVREAAVVVRDYDGEKRLIAYLVGDQCPTAQSLRRTLLSRLPDYMVPSSFVALDVLPLTQTGKVDRLALSKLDLPESEPYVAPRTPVEEVLAGMWVEVLAVDRVGVNDNFFSLGGHSLLLTRLLARVREVFPTEISFRGFFQTPTIAGLAQLIADSESGAEQLSELIDRIEQLSEQEAEELLSGRIAVSWTGTQSVMEKAPDAISSISICTKDRPEALQRALASFAENSLHHGRAPDLVVCDDSASPQPRDACRQMLLSLAKRYGLAVRYAGLEEKSDLIERLVERGIPRETAVFALSDSENCGMTCGANRNAALLATVGEMVFSADDDTSSRTAVHPQPTDGLRVAMGSDPADFWFYPDRESALDSAAFEELDILAGHEGLLGKEIADRGKVLMTFNGLLGDCGWSTPFGYWSSPLGCLLVEGESHERLVGSESHYRMASTSREILRIASQPAISDDTFSMVTFMGLDNRSLLPPYMPVMRGQGLVFGSTMRAAFDRALFGHVPFALVHSPMEKRSFWPGEVLRSASGFDVARLVIECIKSYEGEPAGLEVLGRHIMELGSMPLPDFEAAVLSQARKSSHSFIAEVEARLSACGNSPAFWAKDVKRYLAILSENLEREDYCVPLDLLDRRGVQETRELVRRLIRKFGELLLWWPDIVQAAKELRAQGYDLCRPIS